MCLQHGKINSGVIYIYIFASLAEKQTAAHKHHAAAKRRITQCTRSVSLQRCIFLPFRLFLLSYRKCVPIHSVGQGEINDASRAVRHGRLPALRGVFFFFKQSSGLFVDRLDVTRGVSDGQCAKGDQKVRGCISQQAEEKEWLQRALNDARHINKG